MSAARLQVVLVSGRRPGEGLADVPVIELVACPEAVSAVTLIAAERPVDVVLFDLAPTPRNLSEVAGAAAKLRHARFVALGVVEVQEALDWAEAGVAGFVERRDSVDELWAALVSVMRGELRCSPELGSALLRRVRDPGGGRQPEEHMARLTARELEILDLIGQELSNAEIAERMSLRVPTVKNHVRSIMQKLQVRSRMAAAAVATATRRW